PTGWRQTRLDGSRSSWPAGDDVVAVARHALRHHLKTRISNTPSNVVDPVRSVQDALSNAPLVDPFGNLFQRPSPPRVEENVGGERAARPQDAKDVAESGLHVRKA